MNTVFFPRARRAQRGGLFLGIIIGLLVGLGAALVVALYVTKVPVPFSNKAPVKPSAEQDAQEAQKNKNWDPNAPLYGKNPAKPAASGIVGTATTASGATNTAAKPAAAASAAKSTAVTTATAALPKPAASAAGASAPKAASADPLGDLAKAKAAIAGGAEPFTYFVQAGAFRTPEDAEAQRAKLSMAGFEAKVTEREQSGRTVFRVRVGPLDKQTEAEKAKEKLDGAGFDTAIVRVQR